MDFFKILFPFSLPILTRVTLQQNRDLITLNKKKCLCEREDHMLKIRSHVIKYFLITASDNLFLLFWFPF